MVNAFTSYYILMYTKSIIQYAVCIRNLKFLHSHTSRLPLTTILEIIWKKKLNLLSNYFDFLLFIKGLWLSAFLLV